MEIHRYIEYSLEECIEKGLEEPGNSGYFWGRERRQARGEFKADSSCSVLIFNEDNVFTFYFKYEFILKGAWRASGC